MDNEENVEILEAQTENSVEELAKSNENSENDVKANFKKLDFKELIKKWWFWVIIVALVVIAVVVIIACVNNSKGFVEESKPLEIVDELNHSIDKNEDKEANESEISQYVAPDYKEYVNNLENKPQNKLQALALNYAITYSTKMGMSKINIIRQLINDGFNEENANYAADNCCNNWEEVAKINAIKYIDYEPSSRTMLYQKIVGDGFTEQEATYAVDNADIDYVEQAKKESLLYLSVDNYSQEKLVELLTQVCGYTQEEAQEGVSQALN